MNCHASTILFPLEHDAWYMVTTQFKRAVLRHICDTLTPFCVDTDDRRQVSAETGCPWRAGCTLTFAATCCRRTQDGVRPHITMNTASPYIHVAPYAWKWAWQALVRFGACQLQCLGQHVSHMLRTPAVPDRDSKSAIQAE